MTHPGYRLSAFIDGELNGAERDRVLVHLAKCEPCRADAVALRMLKRRMSALGDACADSSLTGRLIDVAQQGSPFLSGALGGSAWPGLAGFGSAAASRGGHDARLPWLVTLGASALVLAGIGAASFAAGADHPATRQVTPSVDSYLVQHDLTTGVAPATQQASTSAAQPATLVPQPAATPARRPDSATPASVMFPRSIR